LVKISEDRPPKNLHQSSPILTNLDQSPPKLPFPPHARLLAPQGDSAAGGDWWRLVEIGHPKISSNLQQSPPISTNLHRNCLSRPRRGPKSIFRFPPNPATPHGPRVPRIYTQPLTPLSGCTLCQRPICHLPWFNQHQILPPLTLMALMLTHAHSQLFPPLHHPSSPDCD
jgi:hypothetical protein